MWKAGTSKVVAPPVSIKDRSIDPHEQVLNVPIVYWCYGPSKPSSQSSIDAWLCPHCFIGWLGREAGYGPTDRSAARCGLCREPFFSGAVGLLNSVDDSWKVATYGDYPQEAYVGRTWTSVGSVCVVLIMIFPAGCTLIQITATLIYE
jgi:hypothetical protein